MPQDFAIRMIKVPTSVVLMEHQCRHHGMHTCIPPSCASMLVVQHVAAAAAGQGTASDLPLLQDMCPQFTATTCFNDFLCTSLNTD